MYHDIAIIGAGPAGLSLARALNGSGLSVALIDRQSRAELAAPAVDGRDIALTHLSVEVLKRFAAWEAIPTEQVSWIAEARVIDGNSPYVLDFPAGAGGGSPLGYLISNHLIRRALHDVVAPLPEVDWLTEQRVVRVDTDGEAGHIHLQDGEPLQARLVVAADTRFSETRRQMGISARLKDFGRVAIVCWMEHEKPHDNIAWECFHYGRTLAVLPMPGQMSSIVVTVPARHAAELLALDNAQYAADIQKRFGSRLGEMHQIGQRYSYPLVAVHADRFVAQRFALLGDAAVGMHPVTAHGFNLGLAGADVLADEIKRAQRAGRDWSGADVLSRYQNRHRQISLPLYHGTNQIVGLFTDDSLPATLARKAVLRVSNHLPPVKWLIRKKLTAKRHWALPPLPLP